MIWHVETLDGRALESSDGDQPINPASVVKVATSLWALEQLGPDRRFDTRLQARGTIDAGRQTLNGDLVVIGSGDPDFHVENAFMLAQQLNEKGIRTVTGSLLVNDQFWIGWENGSDGREKDPAARANLMATRLRRAMDPTRWDRRIQGVWRGYATRHGLQMTRPPRVEIRGGAARDDRAEAGESTDRMLLIHTSKPLIETLRRFNVFSNNDIERLEPSLGGPEDLASFVARRWGLSVDSMTFETTSGLGVNRLSPRQIVRLLRDFRATCLKHGLPVEALLPVAGCDPGTMTSFDLLERGANAYAVVGKTGTLTSTDGGVSVLAGFASTAQGEAVFCVAVPRAHSHLSWARRLEERWVVDLMSRHGGPRPRTCSVPLPAAEHAAAISAAGLF